MVVIKIIKQATKKEFMIFEKSIFFLLVVNDNNVWLCINFVTNTIPIKPNKYGINF